MTFVFVSYVNSPAFRRPEDWIDRIRAIFGVWEALSVDQTVISIEQIDYTGEYRRGAVLSYFLNYGPKTQRFPLRLHRFIRKLKPDVVVVHGLGYPLQVSLLRLALGPRVRILLQAHADKIPSGAIRAGLQRLADRGTDAYLFTSREMAEPWISRKLIGRVEKVRELMVGSSVFLRIDRETARRRTGCTGSPVFLWAGRLDHNKDPLTLLDGFLGFAKTHPGARLYMIYQTEEQLSLVRELVSDAVVLVGKIAHEEMGYWFSAADYVISTSHAEAFGMAVVEAMSCGCIPILTSIPSHRKITGDGGCGLLFAPGDGAGLQRTLQLAMELDPREEQRKVTCQYAGHLSFEAIARQLDQIVDSL